MNIDETKYIRTEKDGVITFTPIEPEMSYWVPKQGEVFWWVGRAFTTEKEVNRDYEWQKLMIASSNCYKTRELAEKAAKLMKRYSLIVNACLQVDPDFKPDWGDKSQPKFSYYRHENERDTTTRYWNDYLTPCVSSIEKANQVIQILNERGVK